MKNLKHNTTSVVNINDHNGDLNAARNIEREGLSLCGLKVAEYCKPVPRAPLL